MRRKITWILLLAVVGFTLAVQLVSGQGRAPVSPELAARRNALEKELNEIAVVERKLMIPMRDGKRMAADLYRPKDTSKKYPTVFVRTPYNFNYWDVRNGVVRDMSSVIEAVKRGYAHITMNERGHFFSEGNYDILGPPLTDGDDALKWIAGQSWSNGKVGTIGCSSTAEWQLAVAAQGNPAFAAMIPQGFGAGVGRVGGYYEQGNWYRGGAVQMLFIAWLYGEQNQVRPQMPANATQEELIRESKSFDLAQQQPPVDWSKALAHLPEMDIMRAVDGPKGIFADEMPVDTGGAMIKRAPNDPAWYKGGLWHDNMPINVPGFWFMSWYVLWVVPLAALLDYSPLRRFVVLFSYLVTWEMVLYQYITLRPGAWAPLPWRDLLPVAGYMGTAWLWLVCYWLRNWWQHGTRTAQAIQLGQELRQAREAMGDSVVTVADDFGWRTDDLTDYEAGSRSITHVDYALLKERYQI